MPASALDFDLYLVSDRKQTRGRDLLWVVEQALEGGVKAIQLREKDLEGREFFLLAEKAKRLCSDKKAALFINDRVDIALAVDANGVQLGQGSMPVAAARDLLGPGKMVGASTHSLEEAREAERNDADFILFGPVFFTPSKVAYGRPQGLGKLKEIVEKISLPVYAIGGIKADHVEDCKRTGVRGVALISAVVSAGDPRAATEEILRILRR